MGIQVSKENYKFETYITKGRWNSYWNQLAEVIKLSPKNVLEIGVGSGVFKTIITELGVKVTTVDIDPELNPDCVATATDLPFQDSSFDTVVCFQVLEHLPYKNALTAVREITRVSSRNVLISLPDCRANFLLYFYWL
jgi:2-polyprenyl-3-methyl-5-hydroxy-6-metoxy-1,4-benzoquinol methylase